MSALSSPSVGAPAGERTALQATIRWLGETRFAAETDEGRRAYMDGPAELGGANGGAQPMELLLWGVGGCCAFEVVRILRKSRQHVTDCAMEITAERAVTHPKVFTRVHLRFRATGHELSRKAVERAIRLTTEKYCPASILLRRGGVRITHDCELRPAGRALAP